ncbi:DUF3369 domain-containing protein [Spongiibacter sp. KMU-166]|uniref:DUF3369 domain-containing protein n=1 Tax=Spongiibacter thalassae TaxID=2721624 RepID=A0ABX1GHP5_9GAMM|nr:DUF3369 domain-containing protein [Spongiibacter thalassae]NKI17724.1 DUF3369 domain-containing protein [Spongiibacter thalassae]
MNNDDALMLSPDNEDVDGGDSTASIEPWKILIVDDEEAIHAVTKLSLRNMQVLGRSIQLFHARSGKESIEIMRREKDIALVLMDVVMETDHAGLDAVRTIREELNNQEVRLVLRTGQPGQAPEFEVVTHYDINDYKEKTELTSQKLHTLVYTSIGHYRQLVALNQSRSGLESVIDASASIFESHSLVQFTRGVLTQLSALLYSKEDGLIVDAIAVSREAEDQRHRLVVSACSDPNAQLEGMEVDACLPPTVARRIREAAFRQEPLFGEGFFTANFRSRRGDVHIVYLSCDQDFSVADRRLVNLFCHNVAIAFDNQTMYQEVLESQRKLVLLLSQAVEERSEELTNHVKRVAEYTAIIGTCLGISDEDVEVLKLSAALHDVGKIGIPDDILNKPGRLTDEEREVMESHVERGVSILGEQKGNLLTRAGQVVAAHHERWDGNGYPNQLQGEEIDLFGRITSIADVFDALSTRRVYKEPWPMEEVIAYFKEQRGKQFDPVLVDIFLDNMDKVLEIHTRLHCEAA